MVKIPKSTIRASNHIHRGNTMGYKSTIAFDMILLYLKENIDKTTKSTTLQEFQSYIVKNIDEFILSTPEHDEFGTTKRRNRKSTHNVY